MKKFIATAGVIVLAACSNNSQQLSSSDKVQKPAKSMTAKQMTDNQIVCEKSQKTGTRIKKKRCMTAAQKKAEEARAKEMMQQKQLHNNDNVGSLNDGG